MEFCNVDQGLAPFPNALSYTFVKWLALMHCEQVRVNFAKVYLFSCYPAFSKRLQSPELSFVSIAF